MNDGYAAYANVHKRTLSGRNLEAEAFIKAVQLLKTAQNQPGNSRLLADALNFTRKLWTVIQADVSSPKNKLDKKLKSDLLSLSLFVDQKCLEIINRPSFDNLQSLIDVNQNLAGGLME